MSTNLAATFVTSEDTISVKMGRELTITPSDFPFGGWWRERRVCVLEMSGKDDPPESDEKFRLTTLSHFGRMWMTIDHKECVITF